MSLKIRCTRATDGSERFLLSIARGGEVPHVAVMNLEDTEDLILAVTGAVRSYDNAQKKTDPQPDDGGLVA